MKGLKRIPLTTEPRYNMSTVLLTLVFFRFDSSSNKPVINPLKGKQTLTNIYKHLQTFTNNLKHLQTFIGLSNGTPIPDLDKLVESTIKEVNQIFMV